ncbi:MAG: hypothetical protein HY327_02155 [Chloroflexi bacterium]|nr:hypothetical protein [Chloroflexota bacterium]
MRSALKATTDGRLPTAAKSHATADAPNARERLYAFLIALVAVAILQIPYALGYLFARDGSVFTGLLMNPEDANSYFAKMEQGYQGAWLYAIPFTPEDHAPAFIGGFYLALGQLARAVGLSVEMMWHLARIGADAILFLATYAFIASFTRDPRARGTAYLLALFGSGLGWLLFILNQPYWLDAFPVDFKMPEAHLFFSALTFPHVALGTALILASLACARRVITGDPRAIAFSIVAGVANLALAIVYPFLIYLVALAVGIFWLVSALRARKILARAALAGAPMFIIPAPLLLYYARTLADNPVMRAWDAQAITPSPPLPHYLIAFGVFIVLSALTLKSARPEFDLLWAWILAAGLLVYAPLNPQRRFVEGVHVPLAMLTTVALYEIILPALARTRAFARLAALPRYSARGLERLLVFGFLVMMSLSNLYVLASTMFTAAIQQPYPLFRARAEIAAFDWLLRARVSSTPVILGAYETGNYIAARVGNRVVLGHWAETVEWDRKFEQVEQFFRGETDEAARRALIARYRVAYVFYGPRERELGAFDPARADYLEPAYSNAQVTIYRVKR